MYLRLGHRTITQSYPAYALQLAPAAGAVLLSDVFRTGGYLGMRLYSAGESRPTTVPGNGARTAFLRVAIPM